MTDSNDSYDDLERRAMEKLDAVQRVADENSQIIIGTLAVVVVLSLSGIINPGVPAWWPLIPWMVGAAAVTAAGAGIYIWKLVPEPEGILLVSLRGDKPGGEIWELSEDEFEDMSYEGELYQWDNSARRVYEVRRYYPDQNRAVGNWREGEPASEILDKHTPAGAMEAVAELREVYEPEAAKARRLQRRIRGIIRRLDRERTEARARQLDEATGLDSIDATSISDVLEDELPDDLHPHAGGGLDDVDESTNGHRDNAQWEFQQDEYDALLDDDEPTPRGL
ncbi:hypothetical protein SAMN05216226_104229 [Halovenus aranensis]|uniref:DUF8125 domain-containing protein n=1 Tax=Halovenus aranensis TaxID=890420 RepID=A0A1G8UFC1_9EURY|nr:hypothetical protein [Halovenus aranensis]SDJ52503.1 hypothetical protein SAMN05216226_104229 [Halovenus aranensis]